MFFLEAVFEFLLHLKSHSSLTNLYLVQAQRFNSCLLHRLALWLQETEQIFP